MNSILCKDFCKICDKEIINESDIPYVFKGWFVKTCNHDEYSYQIHFIDQRKDFEEYVFDQFSIIIDCSGKYKNKSRLVFNENDEYVLFDKNFEKEIKIDSIKFIEKINKLKTLL